MNNQFTLLYNNIEDVYRACLDSVNRMPLSKIISENYGTKTIVIGFSGSLFSKGEEITVTLEPINNNQTKLVFKSNIVESNSMMPKQNKNIEKIKVVLPTLLPKPIIEDTLPKREMPQVTMEPNNNEQYNKEKGEHIFITDDWTKNDYVYKDSEILKQADTIEELCDEFVVILGNGRHTFIGSLRPNGRGGLGWYKRRNYKIVNVYGAVWTDKGLNYVAEMNAEGEFKLL